MLEAVNCAFFIAENTTGAPNTLKRGDSNAAIFARCRLIGGDSIQKTKPSGAKSVNRKCSHVPKSTDTLPAHLSAGSVHSPCPSHSCGGHFHFPSRKATLCPNILTPGSQHA